MLLSRHAQVAAVAWAEGQEIDMSSSDLPTWFSSSLAKVESEACEARRALDELGFVPWIVHTIIQDARACSEIASDRPFLLPMLKSGGYVSAEEARNIGSRKAQIHDGEVHAVDPSVRLANPNIPRPSDLAPDPIDAIRVSLVSATRICIQRQRLSDASKINSYSVSSAYRMAVDSVLAAFRCNRSSFVNIQRTFSQKIPFIGCVMSLSLSHHMMVS